MRGLSLVVRFWREPVSRVWGGGTVAGSIRGWQLQPATCNKKISPSAKPEEDGDSEKRNLVQRWWWWTALDDGGGVDAAAAPKAPIGASLVE